MVWKAEVVTDIYLALNEIKWGGSYTIQTAIGQSITTITPIAMARYIVAVANGGYVYDVQLIDSIIDAEGNVVNSFDEPRSSMIFRRKSASISLTSRKAWRASSTKAARRTITSAIGRPSSWRSCAAKRERRKKRAGLGKQFLVRLFLSQG